MEEKEIVTKKEKTLTGLANALEGLYNKVHQMKDQEIDDDQQLVQNVKKAYEEWRDAENFFHSVSNDPDLVDHAIYKLEATKSRYTYLLKQAKANGIRMNLH